MDRAKNTGGDTYRLIVTCCNASQVLLLTRGNVCFVPSVKIDPGEGRIAGQLGSELYALCGCHGYCLFVLNLGVGLPHCAVMEVSDPRDIASARICWRPLERRDVARRWSSPKIERSWRNQSKNWTSPSENEIEDLSQDRGGYRIFWRGPNNCSILQASA